MMSILCGEIEGVSPNNPFAGVPLEELILCITHQMGPFKPIKKKKVKIKCQICKKKCKRKFVTNHSYSRVSGSSTFYTCSKKHQKQLEQSLTTEDDASYPFRNEWDY